MYRCCIEHLLRLDQRNRASVCVGIYIKGCFFFFLHEVCFVIVGAGGAGAGYEHHLQDIFTAIAGLGTSGTLAPGSLD